MSILKVVESNENLTKSEEVVVAGQVRKSISTDAVVLIVNARGESVNGDAVFNEVGLETTGYYNWDFNINSTNAHTAEQVAESFPILLDAELTYKEAK